MATQRRRSGDVLDGVPTWTVGDRLRKAREAASIGVEEMAVKIGRSRNSIARYERSSVVDELIVRAYRDYTGVPMEWILTGNGPETANGIPIRETLGITRFDYDSVSSLNLAA